LKAIILVFVVLSLFNFTQAQEPGRSKRDDVARQFTERMSKQLSHPVNFTAEGDTHKTLLREDSLIQPQFGGRFFSRNDVGSFLAGQGFTTVVTTNGTQW
jgi:hypothetical protein